MRKWRISQKISQQWSHQWWIRLNFRNTHQTRSIQRLIILPLCSYISIGIHHCKVEIIKKLVACGISNMRSAHQNSMNSSSRQNSKAILLWTSRTSTTTSRCFSMQLLDSVKTFFLISSPSKYTLSLKNTLSQIVITLTILGIPIPRLPLDNHC